MSGSDPHNLDASLPRQPGRDHPGTGKAYAGLALAISVLAIGFTFLPFLLGMDWLSRGYVLSLPALFVAISAAIVAWYLWWRAASMDRIFSAKDLLAHWTYQPDEWQSYIAEEQQEQTGENVRRTVFIAVLVLAIGGFFWITGRSQGIMMFLIAVVVVLLLAALAFALPRLRTMRLRRLQGEAWITPHGLYFNGILARWDARKTRLESLRWRDAQGDRPALLAFEVSFPSQSGRQAQTVRVPVPRGQEAQGRLILELLCKINTKGTK